MRKEDSIKIDDKEILIRELTVQEILFIASLIGIIPVSPEIDLGDRIKDKPVYEAILSFVSDIDVKSLIGFSPSEIKYMYDSFLIVNKVVFDTIKYLNLDKAFEEAKDQIIKEFMMGFGKEVEGSKYDPGNKKQTGGGPSE